MINNDSEIQRVIGELRRQRPDLRFRDLRGVERTYVRLRERILVPANRSVSASEMISISEWPVVTLLPLTIYHHNLIVTWTQLEASEAKPDGPAIDWRYFSET